MEEEENLSLEFKCLESDRRQREIIWISQHISDLGNDDWIGYLGRFRRGVQAPHSMNRRLSVTWFAPGEFGQDGRVTTTTVLDRGGWPEKVLVQRLYEKAVDRYKRRVLAQHAMDTAKPLDEAELSILLDEGLELGLPEILFDCSVEELLRWIELAEKYAPPVLPPVAVLRRDYGPGSPRDETSTSGPFRGAFVEVMGRFPTYGDWNVARIDAWPRQPFRVLSHDLLTITGESMTDEREIVVRSYPVLVPPDGDDVAEHLLRDAPAGAGEAS